MSHTLFTLFKVIVVGIGLAGCTVVRWRPDAALPNLPIQDVLETTDADHIDLILFDGTRIKGRLVGLQFPEIQVHQNGRSHYADLNEVEFLRIGDKDMTASAVATAAAGIGVTVAVVFGVALLAIALKSSCPFVYVEGPDGTRTLVGEGYSGAIGAALERDDWMAMGELAPGPLSIVLANEAREVHYTDLAELWVVARPDGGRLRATTAGVVGIGAAVAPVAVVDLDGVDRTSALATTGWATDLNTASTMSEPPAREGLVMSFDPVSAGPWVLDLRGGNTTWSDLVVGRVWASFDSDRLDRAMTRFDDVDRESRMRRWREKAGLELVVEVDQGSGWRRVDSLPPLGWVAPRDIVVPLPDLDPELPVRVRVSGGTGFWWVGDAGLAPILDPSPEIVRVAPSAADGGADTDLDALSSSDGVHQVLPQRDTEVRIAFDVPETEGSDVFLHLDGYYTMEPPLGSQPNRRVLVGAALDPEALPLAGLDLFRRYADQVAASSVEPLRIR